MTMRAAAVLSAGIVVLVGDRNSNDSGWLRCDLCIYKERESDGAIMRRVTASGLQRLRN